MVLAAFLLQLAAPAGAQADAPLPDGLVECGGTTTLAAVERYFLDLLRALATPGPPARFNRFVSDRFRIRDGRGRTLTFNLSEVGSVTPGRISIREWQEISRRGAESLRGAGYRGCFLDHGKVWFEGGMANAFGLTLIAKDMPWEEPERGDVVP